MLRSLLEGWGDSELFDELGFIAEYPNRQLTALLGAHEFEGTQHHYFKYDRGLHINECLKDIKDV